MTDREMLELAAKAAGISLEDEHYWINGCWTRWNPLTDDGDALRLAVRLNIGVQSHAGRGDYSLSDDGSGPHVEPHGTNPYAATRRAIVHAAAEIGRNKL